MSRTDTRTLHGAFRAVSNTVRTASVDLLSTVEISGWDVLSLVAAIITFVVGNVVWWLAMIGLLVVGWIYDFIIGGVLHTFTGISISLGGTGDTIVTVVGILLFVVLVVVTGYMATLMLYDEDGDPEFGEDRFGFPFLSLSVPVLATAWFARNVGLSGLVQTRPLIAGLLAGWFLQRAGVYLITSHRQTLLARVITNQRLMMLTVPLGTAWISAGLLVLLYDRLYGPLAASLVEAIVVVPGLEPTPWFAVVIPTALAFSLIAFQFISTFCYAAAGAPATVYFYASRAAARAYHLFTYVVLLRPV